jgi:hypothetical protein
MHGQQTIKFEERNQANNGVYKRNHRKVLLGRLAHSNGQME